MRASSVAVAVVLFSSSCATYSTHVARPEASKNPQAEIEELLGINIYGWAVKVQFRDRSFAVQTAQSDRIVQSTVRCEQLAQTRIGLGMGNFTVHVVEKSGEDTVLCWSKTEEDAEHLVDAIAAFCAPPTPAAAPTTGM